MSATKDQIIDATCDLLESQGFHSTGLNQILKESGAPKGSLYYYFPEGKDGLAEAAIERAGRTVAERITAELSGHDDVAEAVSRFVANIAHSVPNRRTPTPAYLVATRKIWWVGLVAVAVALT